MYNDTKVSVQTRKKAMIDAPEKFNRDTLCQEYGMSEKAFLLCEHLVTSMHRAQDANRLKYAIQQLMAKVTPHGGDKLVSNKRLHQSLVKFIEEYDLTYVTPMR